MQPATPTPTAAPHSHLVFNWIIPLILRSPLHGLLSRSLLLITVRGRNSGTLYTFPVTYVERPGAILVFSNQRWWKNLRGGAAVTLRLRGRIVTGWAEVQDDRLTVVREVQRFLAEKGVRAARMINVRLDPTTALSEIDLAAQTRAHVVVVITVA